MELLIQHEANVNVNARNKSDLRPPWRLASGGRRADLIQALIQHGVDVLL